MLSETDLEWFRNNEVNGIERYFIASDVFPICFLKCVCIRTAAARSIRWDDDAKNKLAIDPENFSSMIVIKDEMEKKL